MAKKNFDDEDGVWRTIGGRKVFIRNGQNLADAMKESGKFKSAKKQEDKQEHKEEIKEQPKDEIKDKKKDKEKELKPKKEKKEKETKEDGIPDKSYDIADKINSDFEDKEVITRDEFENYLTGSYDDEDADIRGILAQDGWETKFESDDEGEEGDLVRLSSKNEKETEKSVSKDSKESDPYDDPESEESQRLMDIESRYDNYLQETEGRGASYGELAHIQGLRGKELDDFEKELDDFENSSQMNEYSDTTGTGRSDKQDQALKLEAKANGLYDDNYRGDDYWDLQEMYEDGSIDSEDVAMQLKDMYKNETGVNKAYKDITGKDLEPQETEKPKRLGGWRINEEGKKEYYERELGDDERGYWTKENGQRVFKENPRYKDNTSTNEREQRLNNLLKQKDDLYNNDKISDDEYYRRVEDIDNKIANEYSSEEIDRAEKQNKSTNETMNNAIREKVGKSKNDERSNRQKELDDINKQIKDLDNSYRKGNVDNLHQLDRELLYDKKRALENEINGTTEKERLDQLMKDLRDITNKTATNKPSNNTLKYTDDEGYKREIGDIYDLGDGNIQFRNVDDNGKLGKMYHTMSKEKFENYKNQSTNETMNDAIREKANNRKISYQKGYSKDGSVRSQNVKISGQERDNINEAIRKEIEAGYPNYKKYANDKYSAEMYLEELGNENYKDTNNTTNRFVKDFLGEDKIKTDRNTRYLVDNKSSSDNKTINQLNDEMLGNKYKGKGQTPSLVYSQGRRIDIANNVDGGQTATIWKDGKIERKTNLPSNVKGDKTKDYFDDYLGKLDKSNNETKNKSTNDTMNNAIREKASKKIKTDQSRSQSNMSEREIKNIKTQKSLKSLIDEGKAKDITTLDDKKTKALRDKHGRLDVVQVTKGLYGMNGALLQSSKTGEYFVITSRNGNLFYWV